MARYHAQGDNEVRLDPIDALHCYLIAESCGEDAMELLTRITMKVRGQKLLATLTLMKRVNGEVNDLAMERESLRIANT